MFGYDFSFLNNRRYPTRHRSISKGNIKMLERTRKAELDNRTLQKRRTRSMVGITLPKIGRIKEERG